MSDNFDLKKYLIENKVTRNSRMMNEAETLNLHDIDEDTFDELYIKHITNNAIDSEKYLVSKGAAPEEAKEIVDEDAVIGGLKDLGVTMTHIATLEVGGTYIDNYKVYNLSDGNVALEEDYLGMVSIVPMKAFEDFKKAVGGMTEMKKKHSKMMKEAIEAKAWLVDEEDGLPGILRFASIEAAKDAQFDEMADDPYNRPLFTSLEDLKKYLDDQYMADYDVEKYRFVK